MHLGVSIRIAQIVFPVVVVEPLRGVQFVGVLRVRGRLFYEPQVITQDDVIAAAIVHSHDRTGLAVTAVAPIQGCDRVPAGQPVVSGRVTLPGGTVPEVVRVTGRQTVGAPIPTIPELERAPENFAAAAALLLDNFFKKFSAAVPVRFLE